MFGGVKTSNGYKVNTLEDREAPQDIYGNYKEKWREKKVADAAW